MIPYGRQSVTDEDIAAVVEVLHSDLITQGPVVPRFEAAIADYCQAEFALAANSGTAALHLACLALDLGPGDYLWTSPITFVASANCARYCGAEVDFVDIDPHTCNMSVEALAQKLKLAEKMGRLPKVVVPVHFAGQPCEMKAIAELANEYGFYVIEDACHALGANYEEHPVGSCRYSDIAVFSFHPVKMITTGEGGMLLTNNKHIFEKAGLLRTHGIQRPTAASWRYEQVALGFNYRLTDIQAALGMSQLSRLDTSLAQRKELAARYRHHLCDLPVELPVQIGSGKSSLHLFVIQLENHARITRDELFEQMRSAGIGVNVHYIPVHTQPYYKDLGFKPGDFPQAERYFERCLTLPLFPGLTEASQDMIVDTLAGLLR